MFAQYAFGFKKGKKKTEERNVNITVPTNKKRLIQDKDKMFLRAYVSLGFS